MSQSPPPPPPPGGYGSPPPPGGYDAYGGPPAGAAGWDVGTALSYGWAKFQANAGQIVLAALALFVGVAVVVVAFVAIQSAIISYDTSFFVVLFLNAVFVAALIVVLQIVGAGIIRGALDIAEGREFTAATVFKLQNVANVVVTALLIGAAVLVGTILCYLPGLVAGFVTSYALYFVVDKNLAPVEAIKASFELVRNNLGNTVLWYIVSAVVGGVGAIACGVGLLVTYPIAIIGTAYTYKKLTGQEVAP